MMAGGMIALAIAFAPGAIVGGLSGVAAGAAGLPVVWQIALGTLVGSGVVTFEAVLAIHCLGGVFDRMEAEST